MRQLEEKMQAYVDLLISRYSVLETVKNEIICAYHMIEQSYINGGKLLIAGNGGSAADAEHMTGELMKGFLLQRTMPEKFTEKLIEQDEALGMILAEKLQGSLPAIALDGCTALSTATMNDCDPLLVFAQKVNGYGDRGDVFLGISTSGNSENILCAAITAKAKGMKVIGLTGENGGKLEQMCDACIKVPGTTNYRIQELHLPVYHCLCMMLEERFFGGRA